MKKRKLFYYYLRYFIGIIWILVCIISFILLHEMTYKESGYLNNYKEFINPIADSLLLGIVLALFNYMTHLYNKYKNLKTLKENIENSLKLSLVIFNYDYDELPDLADKSLSVLCSEILQNYKNYDIYKYQRFFDEIKNNRDTLLLNKIEVTRIDRLHTFLYEGIIANLLLLLNILNEEEEKGKIRQLTKQQILQNQINNTQENIKCFVETCKKFSESFFEEFSNTLEYNDRLRKINN